MASVLSKSHMKQLPKIGQCANAPDFQVQSFAVEFLVRLQKFLPSAKLVQYLPHQLEQDWAALQVPKSFCEELRKALNTFNESKCKRQPSRAVFSMATTGIRAFPAKGSKAKATELGSCGWVDVGVDSLAFDAGL